MKGKKQGMRKSRFFRGVALALVLTLVVTMCPSLAKTATVYAASELTTEQPEIIVTGSGVIGGSSYTEDNVGMEKAYTRAELKEMEGGENVVYSALNSYGSKKIYKASGVYIESLLAGTFFDATKDILKLLDKDGYTVTFDPNGKPTDGGETSGFGEKRYNFPGLANDSEEGKTEVKTMLAWASSNASSKEPETAGSEKSYCTVVTGQLFVTDVNNPMYNKYMQTVQAGNALTEVVLTVGSKEYTRAEVLLMERAERTYNYTSSKGDRTDTVVGVPMSVLLDGCKDSDVVTFGSADNYPVSATGKTVKELIDNNYILAYEKAGEGIYETAKNDSSIYGFLTLYGDGDTPAKLVDNITVTESGSSEDPETPDEPVTPPTEDEDTLGDATAETAAISFVGNGFEKEGFFSISGLKNAEGIEKGEFTFDWMNSAGSTGTTTVEGAEMKNILKSVMKITDDADTIILTSSDGRETTMALDDMFTKDKNGQRPVLAWKEDGIKCEPKLVIGQADANDVNKSKWAKNIVKIEVTEPVGFDYSNSPYKHINNGGVTDADVYNIDAITGATLTVEGPGVEKLVAKSVRDLETEQKGIFRGKFKDTRDGNETERFYEGIDLYHILNNMYTVNDKTGTKEGIILTDSAKKVQIKNRNRITIAEFTLDQVKEAHDAGNPIIVAYGTAYADGTSPAPFVFDNGTNLAPKDLGNEDGCLKLVYDKSSITGDKNNNYTKFSNMAYIYVAEDTTPGYKHDKEKYNSSEYNQYILTITGDKIGREVNYTVEQLEGMVKYDAETNAPAEGSIGFRQEYSLANDSYWYVNEYEGIKLWELLLKSGLSKDAAETYKDSLVSFIAADGFKDNNTYTIEEVADYKALGYYEKNSADIKDNDPETPKYEPNPPEADRINLDKEYPVLLAYGVNGYPYVIQSTEKGYISGIDNAGGPLKVIAGKKDYHEANGSKQTQYLEKVVVGSNDYHYATHKYHEKDVYKNLANTELTVKIYTGSGDDAVEYKTETITVGELEELIYGGVLDKAELGKAKVKANYDAGGYPDLYEGINLSYLLEEVIGLPGQIGTITFSDGSEISEAIDLEALLRMDNGYNNETGVSGLAPMVAYAKNGAPLVKDKKAEGYESEITLAEGEDPITVKNKGGPLCIVVPNSAEGKNDSYDFTNLASITINLEPDNYAHINAPYDEYSKEVVTVFGAGTKITDKKDFTVSKLEEQQKLVVTDDYSVLDENGNLTQVRYRGIKLYDFLKSPEVLLKTNHSDIIVTYGDGNTETFTFDDYSGTYKNTVTGETDLSMILAYGSAYVENTDISDGLPLVGTTESEGYNPEYLNAGGPIKLVVGQKNDADRNATRILDNVTSIEVTAKETDSWNHSSNSVFEQYLDDIVEITVTDKNGTKVFEKDYTVEEIEAMESLIEKSTYDENEYEGIYFWGFINQDLSKYVSLDNLVGIEVTSIDGKGVDVLEQGKSALVNGIVDSEGISHPILLAYGKNGMPLSSGGKKTPTGPGYDSNLDNKGGPIRLMVYGVSGASISEVCKINVKITEAPGEIVLAPKFETAVAGETLSGAASVRSVKFDKNGNMWVGTYGGGALYKAYGSDTYVEYNKANTEGLETSIISAVAPDAEGGVWLSQNASYTDPSGNKGVVYIDKDGKVTTYTTESTNGMLPDNYVQDIQIDKDGNVWFASFGGITKYDPKADTWKTWTEEDGLPAASVTKIELDGNGGMWLGCYPNGEGTKESPFVGGFAYMDKEGNITPYQFRAGFDENSNQSKLADVWVRDIAIDSKGNVWVVASGTNILNNEGGIVWKIEPGKDPVRYTGDELFGTKLNGNDYAEVRVVAADAYGRLLFGTSADGILYVQDTEITESGQFKTVVEYSKETGAWDEPKLNNIYSLDVFGEAIYAGGQGGLAWLGEIDVPEISDKETVGDATADTADISFVGDGFVKDGYFTISGLKNAEGIKKGEFTFDWMNSSGTTGVSTVEGAEMKNILKDIIGITDDADTIKFISSDGQAATMALDDMFAKDKDNQRPVLAWKLDGKKCNPRLIVGQVDENDQNRSKWAKDIVKIEVTSTGGVTEPDEPDTPGTPDEPVTPPADDVVGDATADTADISFVGNGLVKKGYFSIKGLKNAEGLEKGKFEISWMNKAGTTGVAAVEGAEMKAILKGLLGITDAANTIVFTSSDDRVSVMALDDMFVKDKDEQRPVLAWKVDESKEDTPMLVIGQANDTDVNKSKWSKSIVKVEVLETKVAGELDPEEPVKESVGDATADTADISFTGNGFVKDGYFSIKGLKNAEGLEKGKFEISWMNKAGTTGVAVVEGAEMKAILKGLLGITDAANTIVFTSSDDRVSVMALDDMFVKDKDEQRPVLAWKVDESKEDTPMLVIGQANDADVNKSKWSKSIVKVEVLETKVAGELDPVEPETPDDPGKPDEPTEPIAHKMVKTEAKAATCIAEGNIEYYTCEICKKFFADTEGKTELSADKLVVAATGHAVGGFQTVEKAGFDKAGKQEAKCVACDYVETKVIAAAVVPVLKSYTFNKKKKTPTVTVMDTDGNKVSIKTPYFYSKTRKSVGKYKVKVTLTGDNYSGYKYVYFKINPAGKSISKLSKGKKSFTVKWKKASTTYRKQMTGYQIKYSTSSKMSKSKTVTVKSTKATSKTIKKLKAKKYYYVQLRTYKTVKGKKYYSAWSKVKRVKTK